MKLTHDKYTITLRRLTMLTEQGRINLVKRYWFCPWFIRNRGYKQLMQQVSIIFGNKEDKEALESHALWLGLNRDRLILDGLKMAVKYKYNDASTKEFYNRVVRRDLPDKKTALHIIDTKIEGAIKRMNAIAYQMRNNKDEKTNKGITLNEIIERIESIIERPIDRELRLFEFEAKYKEALNKVKQLQKQSQNG